MGEGMEGIFSGQPETIDYVCIVGNSNFMQKCASKSFPGVLNFDEATHSY